MSVMMAVAVVVVIVQVVGPFYVAAARHHKNMAVGAQHLDVGAVQLRQYWRRHDFVDIAENGSAIAEIEHAIEGAEQLVELMRTKQYGDLSFTADLPHHVDGNLLVTCVETDQRLIQ